MAEENKEEVYESSDFIYGENAVKNDKYMESFETPRHDLE